MIRRVTDQELELHGEIARLRRELTRFVKPPDNSDWYRALTECTLCGGDASVRGASFALRTDRPAMTLCRTCLETIAETVNDPDDYFDDSLEDLPGASAMPDFDPYE